MKYTNKLGLPIWNKPETDVFDIEQFNEGMQAIDNIVIHILNQINDLAIGDTKIDLNDYVKEKVFEELKKKVENKSDKEEIEKISSQLDTKANKNDIETINTQLDTNTIKQSKSVTDFIKYKNEKDDWEMLQTCLNSVKQKSDRYSGYVSTGWSEKIIFPTGDYKISKPLVCNLSYPNIDFQGSRIMPTSDFEGDFAIKFTNIWNGKFSNLVLDGFDKHIKMYNNNLDSGNIKIEDVSMYGGSVGYDIECRSSKTTITNFKFNNVKQPSIIRHADKITFRSGWMDAGVLTEDYQGMFEINNYAQVVIEDMIYVPRPQTVD